MSKRKIRTLERHELPEPTEPIANFHWRHGPEYISHNNRLYFSNGAWRENTAYGAMAEPSTDDAARFKMIAFYHELHLKREVKAFDEYRAQCTHPLATSSDENIEHLQKLQATVNDRRSKVDEALAQMKSHQLAPHIKEWEGYIQKHHKELVKLQEELDSFVASLPDSGATDRELDDVEILERQVQRAEHKLQLGCVNLHRAGGTVPDDFQHYLEDYRRQEYEREKHQQELWLKANNITV